MNWITKKLLHLSQKIKTVIKKRPTNEEIENSDWASCCKGPILKKELEFQQTNSIFSFLNNFEDLLIIKGWGGQWILKLWSKKKHQMSSFGPIHNKKVEIQESRPTPKR